MSMSTVACIAGMAPGFSSGRWGLRSLMWTRALRGAPAARPATQTLSAREHEILELLAQGFMYKEIADRLASCYATVRTHIEHIYEKLHVNSRAQAVARFGGG